MKSHQLSPAAVIKLRRRHKQIEQRICCFFFSSSAAAVLGIGPAITQQQQEEEDDDFTRDFLITHGRGVVAAAAANVSYCVCACCALCRQCVVFVMDVARSAVHSTTRAENKFQTMLLALFKRIKLRRHDLATSWSPSATFYLVIKSNWHCCRGISTAIRFTRLLAASLIS